MNTYVVKYLKGTDIQTAYIQGKDQAEAGKEFLRIFPDIDSEKILSSVDIQEQSKDYGAAIKMTKVISFLGWIAVVAGILLSLTMVLITTGIPTIISGIMLIVGAQITRATADNANYSKQMLDEMRNRQ